MKEHASGDTISHEPSSEPCLAIGSVSDFDGKPVEGVKIDIRETGPSGQYDVRYLDREISDERFVDVMTIGGANRRGSG